MSRVCLDDSPVFEATDTGPLWNGFATPLFTRDQLEPILSWLGWTHAWTGDVLTLTDPEWGEADVMEPDAQGLYEFLGWCWWLVSRDETEGTARRHA